MLKGCLKSLAILAGLIAGYYYVLHGRISPPGDRWGALAPGFGMWLVPGLARDLPNAHAKPKAVTRSARGPAGGLGPKCTKLSKS